MDRLNLIKGHLEAKNTLTPQESAWVLKFEPALTFNKVGSLKGKTLFITGASRGIGLAIAVRAAQDGANVALVAKTTEPHPKLPGTLFTAAEEVEKAGGKALPIKCDIRYEDQVKAAVAKCVEKFGGIDILINNASAISLQSVEDLTMKTFDLMHQINARGTYMTTKYCLPHLKKSSNPHVLMLSPPLPVDDRWLAGQVGYSMAKLGMSMCVSGMAPEFKDDGIAVNALWPRTSIATAAVANKLGGDSMMRSSRKVEIMGDAAYIILTSDSKETTGNFFVDDSVITSNGTLDLSKYACDPTMPYHFYTADFFL
mmetsp:Transcript_50895/g.58364  ORF Transcript_50895/g.58364 Transcript_50895/m.58364 type:complete len:313 (+) Transcript_50895:100-1038(+)